MEELKDKINESDNNDTTEKPETETEAENDSVLIIGCENELAQDDLIDEELEIEPRKTTNAANKPPLKETKDVSAIVKSQENSPKRRRSRSNSRPRYGSQSRKTRSRSRSPLHKTYRPLSPLIIDHEILSSITRAPLSPRSAAFVLQNREILARRKMSPQKSSPRRSPSPRRSRLEPVRRRSRSPRFKRSLSPRGRSPRSFSPRRRSVSPRNRFRGARDERHGGLGTKKGSRSPVNRLLPLKRTGKIF